MSVSLATKCLNFIIKSIGASFIRNVRIFIHAHVVLSWILAGKAKSKKFLASSRISDITCPIKTIEEYFGLQYKFRYDLKLEPTVPNLCMMRIF